MKKKILLSVFTILALAVGVFAYAFTVNSTDSATKMSCNCCTGDSCPLKKTNASGTETVSCCDDCDCGSGDSCPMKNMGGPSATGMKMAEGESCPMMKTTKASTGLNVDIKHETSAKDKKSCDCSCCNHNQEKKDASAV